MDSDTITGSTMMLADSPRAATAAAGDRSADPSTEPGRDTPPGAADANLAAETVARLIRAMVDACPGDDLSRFEAPGLGAPPSHETPDAADLSSFVSPPMAEAPSEHADASCFVANGFSPPEASPPDDRIARLVRELIGLLPRAGITRIDEVRARYPEIPDAALRLIARETERGWPPPPPGGSDLAAPPTVETITQHPGHRLPPFPSVGDTVGEYRLLAALGRGVRGAVFLADQPSLANRPVVLKITARDGREHLSLAQLRHPHIVALYCVQELADRNLRLLCMPYLGGAPLTRVLAELEEIPIARRTGRDLLAGLDRAQACAPLHVPDRGPPRQFLARASYSQAVCWVGACLADALHFAHQRDLVHLDLKPSNILLASDGTPMLLDFHLAQPPIRPDDPSPRWLGGTPHFMSPEQRLAMLEIHERTPITVAVDGRSDVYALGLVLYHVLGGAISIGPYPMDRIRFRRPPRVPVGLADILARCLAFDPGDRYPDAGALADDLRRHLANLPLRGVRNRSAIERIRKWSRRHPHAVARTGRTLATLAAIGLAGWLYAGADARHRLRAADSMLAEGRKQMEHGDYPAAVLAFGQGLNQLDGCWIDPPESPPSRAAALRTDLATALARARRDRLAGEIHGLADRLRFLYGTDVKPTDDLRNLEQRLGRTWDARGRILAQWDNAPDDRLGQRLRTDLLDLGILWSDLRVRLAAGPKKEGARREALRTLAEAERLFGAGPVLAHEHQTHAQALGLADEARAAARAVSSLSPRTAWEHYALGRSLLASGELDAAAREFERATDLQPQDLWAQFSRGLCAYRRRRYHDALRAFEVCVALSPATAACYHNRGLAHAALGHAEQARRDEDHARRLSPGLVHDRQP